SMRNWMPVLSMAWPIAPPRASISRTICPLATPPMAGLQLIWATVSQLVVRRAVLAPMRAAASAASQPAWPAPMTRMSNASEDSNAEFGKRKAECILTRMPTPSRGSNVPESHLQVVDAWVVGVVGFGVEVDFERIGQLQGFFGFGKLDWVAAVCDQQHFAG